MIKTIIVLPDGTELSSGTGTVNAVRSITVTECVNAEQELNPGSVCANMLEAKLITPAGGLPLTAGDEVAVYKEDDAGMRHKVGLFILEKPTRPTANTMAITAYDRISRLDKDLTGWLAEFNLWPCSLYQLADMVCAACGVELATESIPNGDYQIQKFTGEGITGRQLLQWVGQLAGRFCRATPDGLIEFSWYTPVTGYAIGPAAIAGSADVTFADGYISIISDDIATSFVDGSLELSGNILTVSDDGNGNVTLTVSQGMETLFYYGGSLSFEDYTVAPIEKVQLRQNEEDVGTVWPDTVEALNTYAVTGNYLLTNMSAGGLVPVAQTLYEELQGFSYTPCKVSIASNPYIRPGHILNITDANGRTFSALVMTKKQSGQKDTLECTGSPRRGSSSAVNNQTFKALSGKVLNLRTDVDGLKVENADAAGRAARIEADLEGIRTQVAGIPGMEQRMTQLEQTAAALEVRVTRVDAGKGEGATSVTTETGYTFDQNGLRISKTGGQMENLLNNNGMYVTRGGEEILRADAAGVNAIDITVRNYLVVGTHARFEDYDGGTGCFWI